jgi:hypothetical protein
MQEPHIKETLFYVQLFQIEATHLLKMVINILDCNPHNIYFQATQLIGVLEKCVQYKDKLNKL